jgi:tRNA(Ile)-lysidine synthase
MAASRNRPPAEPAAQLAALLRAVLPEDALLWVGLSGGRDSVVLLHLCHALLPGRLKALHVHHGLSGNADAWARFCKTLCADWEIPLVIEPVTVERRAKEGLEAAARSARYRAFQTCARRDGLRYLALAHHQRDQTETLLLNLFRGAGLAGLCAMPAVREMEGFTLLRPFLACAAETLADHARKAALSWIEDESNRETRHTRNFLRHAVLPQLTARFPAIETTCARAAENLSETRALLMECAQEDDAKLRGAPDAAPRLEALLTLSPARQANWLRYWLTRTGWRVPPRARLTEALRQLAGLSHGKDGNFALLLPEGSLRLWQGGLYCVSPARPETPRLWDGRTPCAWAGGTLCLERREGEGIDLARLRGRCLALRPRQGGERLRLAAGRPERALKHLLREAGLPPWRRAALPLLYLDDTLIACPDIGIAAAYQCPPEHPGYVPVLRGPADGNSPP